MASATYLLNGAISQLDRIRAAPAPEKFKVDGRSLAQLLAFAARYGALIQFYDLDDLPSGDWSDFFATDPAIANAIHAALDLPEIEDTLRSLLAEMRETNDRSARRSRLKRILGTIAQLISILDRSFQGSSNDIVAQLAAIAMADRKDGLAAPLKLLGSFFSDTGHAGWADRDANAPDEDWLEPPLNILEDIIAAVIEELRHGAVIALAAVEASLRTDGHAPQAALYNAFVVLFDEARQELNRFPRRLLDFYYGDILKQDSRPAEPDQVFLTFTLAKGANQASIPKGALFSAGTDSQGQSIYYAADWSLEVTPASVSGLSVHRITYADDDPSLPVGVMSGTVAGVSGGVPQSGPFPLFGSDVAGTFGSLTMLPASLGFIVASSALMLCGGVRTIVMTLSLSPASIVEARNAQGQGLSSTGHSAAETKALTEILDLEPAFELYYSTAGGWMPVNSCTMTPSIPAGGAGPATITVSFVLPADAPPLVPVSTKPAAGAPVPPLPATAFSDPTDQPAIVAKLLYDASAPTGGKTDRKIQYAILSLIDVATVALDVTVENLAPATLSGPNGPIDPSQNFALFGMPPAQYATLEISAPELFIKQLTGLSVSIAWAGLPVTSTGFQGYYQSYVLDADGAVSQQPLFDNTSFKVAFTLISPGPWSLDPTAQLYLFQTDGSSTSAAGPAPAAGAALIQTSLLAASGITPATVPAYYNPGLSAVGLTLVDPSYAFGNILYTSNLTAASIANIATLQAGTQKASATTQIANAATVNATAPDKSYSETVTPAVKTAISALNGKALGSLQQAVAGSSASADVQSQQQQSLKTAIAAKPSRSSLWSRLAGGAASAANDVSTVTAGLKAWLSTHEAELAQTASTELGHAGTAIMAAESLASTFSGSAGLAAAVARPIMAAALQQAQSALSPTVTQSTSTTAGTTPPTLPNPPWLPMASSVSVNYTATVTTTIATSDSTSAAAVPGSASQGGAEAPVSTGYLVGDQFLHLRPFDQIMRAASSPGGAATLLPRVAQKAALYIDLSAPARQVSLLFTLQAGPNGWSTETPTVSWEQLIGNDWRAIEVLVDGTNALLNSGIVSLQLAKLPRADAAPSLRVRLVKGMDNAPLVTSVIANAVQATWVGPGGAAQLGDQLAAGTISQSKTAIAGVGTIGQPMDSVGGCPPAVGRPFDMWMAERLRHKGFAIDAWDYAQIVLAAIPSLWQLAVVSATDGSTGQPAPGQIWLVAVAGPKTPNISDPTVPSVDPAVLTEIGEMIETISSPFVQLTVTNPPFLRLTVVADLVFSDADTVVFWKKRLQGELVKWLSPWPDPALGYRPDDYYTRQSVADFVRRRAYVLAIISLEVVPEGKPANAGWCYYTSSLKHALRGKLAPAPSTETSGGSSPRHGAAAAGNTATALERTV